MAIEEEFGVEIPDAEADEITTVQQGESYARARARQGVVMLTGSSYRLHCQGMSNHAES